MKLIKCHVEAYGKIKSQDFDFNNGITTFYFENGHGKSTLASFIKAMFFGLRPVRANAKDFEDRRRFYPFSGGKFGGNITFEFKGKTYKVERFFDVKSDTKDTVTVYRNGAVTDELGENIGQTVFGLDQDSFERTVFMSANDAFYGSTHGVSSRLGSYALGDDASFVEAYSAIEAKKKQIKAARGHNDLISRETDKIRELEIKIKNLEDMQDELERYLSEKNALQKTVERLNGEEKRINSKKLLNEKKSTYARYLKEIDDKESVIAQISGRYPCDLMSKERVDKVKERISALDRDLGASDAVGFTEERLERLNYLRGRLGGNEALDGDIFALEESKKRCEQIDVELSSSGEELRSGDRFAHGIPSSAVIEEQKKNAARYKELSEKADELLSGKKKRRVNLPLLIIGTVALVSAAGLLLVDKIIAAAFGGAAILFIILSFIVKESDGRLQGLMSEAGEYERALKDFLSPYGYSTEGRGGAAYDFSRFLSDLDAYREQTVGKERLRIERSRLLTERDALTKRSLAKLSSYGIDIESVDEGISVIKKLRDEYNSLSRDYLESSNRKRGLDEEIKEAKNLIATMLDGCEIILDDGEKADLGTLYARSPGSIPEILEKMEIDRYTLTAHQRDLIRLRETAEKYRSYNGLDAKDALLFSAVPSEEEGSLLTELASLPEKIEELARIDRQISEIEAIVEYLPEHKNELEISKERLASLKHRDFILSTAMEALACAEKNLSERYIAPVRDRFIAFAGQIESTIGESYTMDREFNVRFEEYGESRDERHLSLGQHAIVALALRLSLVDAMYESDPPFIILDDPFSSVDEKHLDKIRALLKKIEKTHQIVYFTCHNSRVL